MAIEWYHCNKKNRHVDIINRHVDIVNRRVNVVVWQSAHGATNRATVHNTQISEYVLRTTSE